MKPEDFLRTTKVLQEKTNDRMKSTIMGLKALNPQPNPDKQIMESVLTDKERDEMLFRVMEYCQRILTAIEALQNGQPFNESMKMNNDFQKGL